MNERETRTPQPKAMRPSQQRLVEEELKLPARLTHLRHLPWAECYKRQLHAENKSLNTQKSYFYGLRSLVETTLHREPVLSESEYESLSIESLAQRMEPMNGRIDLWAHSIAGLRPTTYNARLAAARHLLRWLGLIWPEHLQRARTGKRLPRTLTRRELTTVLETASVSENPATAFLVTMMLDTGMRVSEVCGLNLDDIDVDDASALIRGGKGDKDRLVLFTERTLERLQAWLPIRTALVGESEDACLVNRHGRRLQPRSVQRMMDTLGEQAGLPKGKLTPHVLRHNFATGLLERGADLVTIQRLMGHATIATTRVYLEISDQTLREVYHRAQALRENMGHAGQNEEQMVETTPSTSSSGIETEL
ncbi:MAG: tyrosine-type recombinase/integrase [Candidatus Poseidonia sp.]|uniref:tyrosine-type recombinase/integrase n=1 Tax=Poseidonia sp. TaxID=2666344 RepID=UPI0030BEF2AD|nr:tyrosine-type recombinase/integrase [Poseidonia sp.]MDG1551948.1 tyrosine-type recombinase/integrase [Poseidonia sp.]